MNEKQEEVLERIRYAWVHADRAMEKTPVVDRDHVKEVLSGGCFWILHTLDVVAEATDRTVEWLLTGEDEGTRLLSDPEFVESLEQLRDGKAVPATTLEEEQAACPHKKTWFDRTVCPEPCGMMHSYCTNCAVQVDECSVSEEAFFYDGQDLNELCGCGHAAMVHTSGSGNCLALGESRQQDSHCLEFNPKIVEKGGIHLLDEPCDSNCLCEKTPMEPVPVAEAGPVTQWHVFTPDGTGACIGCGGGVEDAIHNGLKTGTTCSECLHASPHDLDGIGICRVKDCGCDGPEQMCEECPHAWDLHLVGDNGCMYCECMAGARVQRPIPRSLGMGNGPTDLSLCDECHSGVHTFPRRVVALEQRADSDSCTEWVSFVYADRDGDELEISDGHTVPDGQKGVFIQASPNGVLVPLDTLEAVIDAIRESGRRAMEEPK